MMTEPKMKIGLTTLVAMAMIWATSVYGQPVDQCIELLRLSRTSLRTVINDRQFQDTRFLFCEEYKRSRSHGDSANYGGAFELLGVSMGMSNRTEDNVAKKYCRFEGDQREQVGSFEEYINGIDPGAYGAYQACVGARNSGVQISLLGDITQSRLELRVEHTTSRGTGSAELTWSSSAPVNCRVDREGEESGSRRFVLNLNERIVLVCSRDDPRATPVLEPDYVNVVRNDGSAAVSVSWPKYNHEGLPFQTLRDVRHQVSSEIESLRNEVKRNLDTLATLRGELGELVRECRICFQEVEGSSQCQRSRNTCSGWSSPGNTGDWSEVFRDDTDDRGGGCAYQWRLECRGRP